MSIYDALAKGAAPTLPAQLQSSLVYLERIAKSLDGIASLLQPSARPPAPEYQPRWLQLPHTPPSPAVVTGLIASADTAGLYSIQVGNGIAFSFRLQANATAIFDLTTMGGLVIYQGMTISLNLASGATGEATIIYRVRE